MPRYMYHTCISHIYGGQSKYKYFGAPSGRDKSIYQSAKGDAILALHAVLNLKFSSVRVGRDRSRACMRTIARTIARTRRTYAVTHTREYSCTRALSIISINVSCDVLNLVLIVRIARLSPAARDLLLQEALLLLAPCRTPP